MGQDGPHAEGLVGSGVRAELQSMQGSAVWSMGSNGEEHIRRMRAGSLTESSMRIGLVRAPQS